MPTIDDLLLADGDVLKKKRLNKSDMDYLLDPTSATKELSPIERFMADQEKDATQKLIETQRGDIDPTRQAKALDVSQENGVSPSVAYQFPNGFVPKAKDPDFLALSKSNPETSKIMADRDKGPVTKGDHGPLSIIEDGFKSMGIRPAKYGSRAEAVAGAKKEFEKDQTTRKSNDKIDVGEFTNAFMRSAGPTNVELIGQTLGAYGDLTGDKSWEQESADLVSEGAKWRSAIAEPRVGSFTDIKLFEEGSAQRIADYVAQGAGQSGSFLVPMISGILGAGIGQRVAGKAGAVVGGFGGAFIGSDMINVGSMRKTLMEEGLGNDFSGRSRTPEQEKQFGLDKELRGKIAVVGGSVMSALDSLLPGSIGTKLGGGVRQEAQKIMAKRLIIAARNGALKEGVTEAAQEAIEYISGKLGSGKEIDVKELAIRVTDAAIIGAIIGGPANAASEIPAARAQRNKARLDDIAKAVNSSSTMKLSPSIVEEHFRNIGEQQGAPSHVSASHDAIVTLFQSEGIDAAEVEKRFPEVVKALDEAAQTGAEVTFPIEQIATLAELKGYQEFSQDMRVGPNEMTAREADVSGKDMEKQFETLVNQTERPDTSTFDSVKEQLVAAGQAPDVATNQAALFASVIHTQAERAGINPKEMMARHGFTVESSEVTPEGALKQGLAETPLPSVGEEVLFPISKLLQSADGNATATNAVRGGAKSQTNAPIAVSLTPDGQVYVLNGYHRIQEALTRGDKNIEIKVEPWSDGFQERFNNEKGNFVGGLKKQKDNVKVDTVANSSIDTSAANGKTLTQGGVSNDQGTNLRRRDGGHSERNLAPIKGAPAYIAFSPTQIKSIFNRGTFDLNDASILNQENRGSIAFGPARDKFKVTLTGKADLSTFLHESGHFFLEIMHDLVERGEASAQQVADLAAVRSWLGAKEGASITTPQHENFAKGFEAYLMEGKAPSIELESAFNKFKAWMVFIYKRLTTLNVNLNDDIRNVMDRLVATDAAIAEARAQIGYKPPMPQDQIGLTDTEYKAYTEAWTKAHDAQQQDIDARVMIEAARATKAAWREELAKVTEELTAQVETLQGNIAMQKIAEQPIQADSVPDTLRSAARGLTAEEGLPLDIVAEGLGYASGEEMLGSIAEAKAAKKSIRLRAKAIMIERHGEMTPANISEAAAKAVHNAPTLEVMLTEFRAMSAKAGIKVKKGIADFLRRQAEAKTSQLTERDLNPSLWRRAELKAAEQSGALAAKGKDLEASLAKRQQMMAAAMHRATTEAQNRIQTIRDYLTTFTKDKRRATLGKAGEIYLDGIDQILENIEFKDVSLKLLKKRATIAELMAEAEANEEPLSIPDYLLVKSTNYSKMTLEQLEGVHDAVKNLWTLAKLKNTLRDRHQKRALDSALAEMAETAEKALGTRKVRDMLNPTVITKAVNNIRWVRSKLVKMEFLFGWLDGKPDGGLMHRLIYQPIADARKAEFYMLRDMHSLILDRMRGMPKEQKARWETKRKFMGENVRGANVIAAALNLGNESNKEKLLKGYKWEESHLMSEINSFMTKEDWDIVQHIWDSIETLWPQIEKVAQGATGLKPPKIERSTIETPFGDYSGGYYPVVYDPEADHAVFKRAEQSASANGLFANNFMRPTAANGFTKERVKYAAPILLSLDVISNHVAEVIHYVTHYEALTQADKISRHPKFRKIVQDTMGKEFYREIRPWLQDIANNVTQRKRSELGESSFRYLRNGVSIGAMGYNVGTAFKQLLGVATALDAISPRYWASGIAKSWTSPNLVQNWKFALEASAELRPLIKDFDRDLKQLNDAYEKKIVGGVKNAFIRHAFSMIGYFQLAVNVATWHGAYEQGLSQDMDHEKAVDHADSVVRKTQSSGAIKDLSDVQRSGEATKILTMFSSFFNVLYNRGEDIHMTTKGVKDVPKAVMRVGVLAILPSILMIAGQDAYRAMLKDDEDDDDAQPYLQRLATESANYVIGSLPVLRGFLTIGHKPQLSPINSVPEKVYNSFKAIEKLYAGEEITRKQVKNLIDTTGIITHTPGASVYKLVDDMIGDIN